MDQLWNDREKHEETAQQKEGFGSEWMIRMYKQYTYHNKDGQGNKSPTKRATNNCA